MLPSYGRSDCLTWTTLLQLSFPVNVNIQAERNTLARGTLSEGLLLHIGPIARENEISVDVNEGVPNVSASACYCAFIDMTS